MGLGVGSLDGLAVGAIFVVGFAVSTKNVTEALNFLSNVVSPWIRKL